MVRASYLTGMGFMTNSRIPTPFAYSSVEVPLKPVQTYHGCIHCMEIPAGSNIPIWFVPARCKINNRNVLRKSIDFKNCLCGQFCSSFGRKMPIKHPVD